MHKLLERQLKRTIGSIDSISKEWKDFIKIVDEVYCQADTDRTLMERSLDLTSEELFKKNQQLQQQVVDLQRTQETLSKQASELELVTQVSTAASTILDTQALLQTVVDLTKDRFGLYHAHIYLLDELGETLVLAAGAGQVGQQMVAEGWNIPFEQEQSLVARAARTRQGVRIDDVCETPDWLPNPLLPDTRSELAVPLIVGERVLGVLDVQSDEVGRFTEDDIRIQTTLAAQVAVALENARLFEEGQRSSFLLNERVKEIDCLNDIGREMEESPPPLPELLQWVTERIPSAMQHPDISVVAIEFDGQVYGAPEAIELSNQIVHGLYIGGELMGRIYIAHTEKRDFIDEESALLGGIATRISGFIENQRLLEQTQQRSVELEKVLAEVRQLAAIVENHPDFIGVGALDGKMLYVNPAGLKMMGLPPDHNVTAMDTNDFHPAVEVEKFVKEGLPTALEKGSWSGEANLLKVDGTTIPVDETIGVNYDTTGTPYSLSITMRDITEQKVAAEALRVSEERFALAMQGTNDGLWDWDIANNTVYWSPRLKEMHGYADDELDVDLDTFSSLLHPDDKEQMKAAIKAHLKDRVPLSLENRARTKSGEYRWHYMRGQAVWDETGRALRLVGSVTDITERKRTEEALRQSEALFAKTFHAGPTPMAISRVSDAMLIDVNQRWEDQWGYRREEVIGRTALDLNLYADPNDPVRLRQLIREHGFVRDYELKVRLESGELRDMLMSLEGVEIYGGARFLATFYDITEQKQAKESLTKRVTELETVAQVSAAALTILDTKELLQTVVDLTKDRFGLYGCWRG